MYMSLSALPILACTGFPAVGEICVERLIMSLCAVNDVLLAVLLVSNLLVLPAQASRRQMRFARSG